MFIAILHYAAYLCSCTRLQHYLWGETQVFRFVATGSGSAGLELDYVRPWEKSAAPARTFHLGVTVR